MLACLITGEIESNFPEGIEVDNDAEEPPTTQPASQPASRPARRRLEAIKSVKDGAVLVVSDVDCITNQFAYRFAFGTMAQVGDNASLVLNTMDYFAESQDLIATRSRAGYRRRFLVFDEIEDKADEKTAEAVDKINEQIKEHRKELRKLISEADSGNVGLLKQKILAEQREREIKVRNLEKELRILQSGKREQIEAMTDYLTYLNVLGTPALLFLIAITLGIVRFAVAKSYTSKRT